MLAMNSSKCDRTFELRPHIFREEFTGASHETKLKRLELKWQTFPHALVLIVGVSDETKLPTSRNMGVLTPPTPPNDPKAEAST